MKSPAAGATLEANLLGQVPVEGEKEKQEVRIGQESMAQWGALLSVLAIARS
jgi:hypothetical protein